MNLMILIVDEEVNIDSETLTTLSRNSAFFIYEIYILYTFFCL